MLLEMLSSLSCQRYETDFSRLGEAETDVGQKNKAKNSSVLSQLGMLSFNARLQA